MVSTSHIRHAGLILLTFAFSTMSAHAQLTPDQQAEMMLNSANKAASEKNYPFAIQRYREFLQKFGNHKEAGAARFSLGSAMLEMPEKNYQEIRDHFQAAATNKDFPDQGLAQFFLALTTRAQGLNEIVLADQRPNEAAQRRPQAMQRFNEALGFYNIALKTLAKKAVEKPGVGVDLSSHQEWVARAVCDISELQLRLGKFKDCLEGTKVFLTDPVFSKSKYRGQAVYHHGHACLLLKDFVAAQKALATLAPFSDALFGPHARYLLARTHHELEERTEAAGHYEAAVSDYVKTKEKAVELLKQPANIKNPDLRSQLELIVKGPVPDHIGRSMLYLGAIQYEAGKYAEARAKFEDFLKQFPSSPLKTEAELRIGFCKVQQKDFAEAIKSLTPLVDRDPKLSDQVLYWLGKAQVGAAPDPATNFQAYQQAVGTGIGTLRQAVDRAQRIQDQDPEAKARRGEILLEIADQLQAVKQHREAVQVYAQILNEKILPEREEETSHRLLTGMHLAGDLNDADKACLRFKEKYPQSTLLPAVDFVFAENGYFRMLTAEKIPDAKVRQKDLPPLQEEAIKRFQHVVQKYPEFPKLPIARYSLGLTHYRKGDFDAAIKTLKDIPPAERGGELLLVPFLIADCIFRQTPTLIPEDALATAKMEEQIKETIELLETYVSGAPKSNETPDALLKYGLCQQRLAQLLQQPPDRVKCFQAARAAYEKIAADFKGHALVPQATLERAKIFAQSGDINTAINELRRFTTDPLRAAKVAPMALIQLATYVRSQNRPAEAMDILQKAREQHEGALAGDPERVSWLALLRYHHGVATREAGKLPEARNHFQTVLQTQQNQAVAIEAALRWAQCMKDEGNQRLELARKLKPNAKKPEEYSQVKTHYEEGQKSIREAANFLDKQMEQAIKANGAPEVRARLIYEAAWCSRILAEPEIELARGKIAAELIKTLPKGAEKFPPPEVALEKIPPQPAEVKAQKLYGTLIEQFGESPLSSEARFELAEMLTQRQQHGLAVKLLQDVLDKEPAQELTDKTRLRLGSIYAAQGNVKGALAQFDAVANNPKSLFMGWGQYHAAELQLKEKQIPDAIKRLSQFRDNGQLHNIAGLTDRALLRLGFALTLTQSWDTSRLAYERLVNGFPQSPWAIDGLYGIGWTWQQQKNHEQAVNFYSQVTARSAAEVAAKAQFQIGVCRVEQKRHLDAANAFLVVPFTYDYPELTAASLFEGAKAYEELRQFDQAIRLLDRLQRDFQGTPWADAAKEKIDLLRR